MAIEGLDAHVSPLFYPLFYTFGVEFELIVKYKHADRGQKQSSTEGSPAFCCDNRNRNAHILGRVIEVLRQAGLQVNDYNTRGDWVCWTVKTSSTIGALPADKDTINVWSFCPVKITMPVMRFERNEEYEPFREIERMLRALKKKFKVVVNSTCGLHVHVGAFTDPHDKQWFFSRGFPLQTLRNFTQLVSLFELEINALHPPTRVIHPKCCEPPSQLLPETDDPVSLIEQCEDFVTLNRLWEGKNRYCNDNNDNNNAATKDTSEVIADSLPAYDLSTLHESDPRGDEDPRRTIVFRQHKGTLLYEDVYHWVKLAVRMVKFSHECGLGGLPLRLLRCRDEERHWPSGHFNTISFLKAIGAFEQAGYYSDKLYKYPRPLPLHFGYKEGEIVHDCGSGVRYPDDTTEVCNAEKGASGKAEREGQDMVDEWDLTNRELDY
ncbi:hypothetical protein VTN00DRAFT_8116 [Thermoascus crustaceus]|uniref:uncharacterized protein n=1 Tax=Thermoascus crustaceus TaxID=5088 RepID=UPI003742A13E